MSDPVSAPAHYAGDGEVECRRALRSMMAGYDRAEGMGGSSKYWLGCALKYVWRAPLKNGRQDLEKAAQCIRYAIEEWEEPNG